MLFGAFGSNSITRAPDGLVLVMLFGASGSNSITEASDGLVLVMLFGAFVSKSITGASGGPAAGPFGMDRPGQAPRMRAKSQLRTAKLPK